MNRESDVRPAPRLSRHQPAARHLGGPLDRHGLVVGRQETRSHPPPCLQLCGSSGRPDIWPT